MHIRSNYARAPRMTSHRLKKDRKACGHGANDRSISAVQFYRVSGNFSFFFPVKSEAVRLLPTIDVTVKVSVHICRASKTRSWC